MSKQYNDVLVAAMHQATNSENLNAAKNWTLFERVAAGDAAAREEMIVGNMPLAVARAEGFVRLCPEVSHLRDDLTSAAFTGLVKAVNQMARGCDIKDPTKWHPTDCILSWIGRELGEVLDNSPLIHPSTRSRYRALARGEEVSLPTVRPAIPDDLGTPPCEGAMEACDSLVARCTGEEERAFVAMRVQGRTHAEIAAVLGTSLSGVRRLKKQLEARLRHELGLPPAKKTASGKKSRCARPKSAAPCHL